MSAWMTRELDRFFRALPGARTAPRPLLDVLDAEVAALAEGYVANVPCVLAALGPSLPELAALREQVAKGHYFRDGWAAVVEASLAGAIVDPYFESAADAIVDGDEQALRTLLAEHPGLARARSPFGHHQTLLQHVSANGIEATRQWQSPACAVRLAELLLAAGAEPDVTCDSYNDGSTALTLLVSSVHPHAAGVQADLVEALVRGGARADGIDAYATPLWTAITFGYADAAARLAAVGARVDNVVLAAAIGDLDRVRASFAGERGEGALLPQTAASATRLGGWGPALDPSHLLDYALIYAAALGRREVVEWLLTKGPDLRATEPMWKNTAAEAARYGKHAEIRTILEAAAAGGS
jgi:hypothetical protein